MIKLLRQRFNSIHFAAAFWILVAIRMYFNGVLPLMDKTEARYGEIARLMSETGNWITPPVLRSAVADMYLET